MQSWLIDRPIAHRGLHDISKGIPENSMLAFDEAIKHNFNIELDVYCTKDGEIIVFHDFTLTRICGVKVPTNSLRSSDLDKYRLQKTEEKIPLFKDVLKLVDGKVGIVIELKDIDMAHPYKLERAVAKLLDEYKGDYCIKSFNPAAVRWFTKKRPDVLRGQLTSLRMPLVVRKLLIMRYNKPIFVSCNIANYPNKHVLKKFANDNHMIITWTVRTSAEIANAEKFAQNIIFEDLPIDEVNAYYDRKVEKLKSK